MDLDRGRKSEARMPFHPAKSRSIIGSRPCSGRYRKSRPRDMSADDQQDPTPETPWRPPSLCPLDALPRTGCPTGYSAGGVGGQAPAWRRPRRARPRPRDQAAADLSRVLAMAVLHDAPEARSGDIPGPAELGSPRQARLEASLPTTSRTRPPPRAAPSPSTRSRTAGRRASSRPVIASSWAFACWDMSGPGGVG